MIVGRRLRPLCEELWRKGSSTNSLVSFWKWTYIQIYPPYFRYYRERYQWNKTMVSRFPRDMKNGMRNIARRGVKLSDSENPWAISLTHFSHVVCLTSLVPSIYSYPLTFWMPSGSKGARSRIVSLESSAHSSPWGWWFYRSLVLSLCSQQLLITSTVNLCARRQVGDLLYSIPPLSSRF